MRSGSEKFLSLRAVKFGKCGNWIRAHFCCLPPRDVWHYFLHEELLKKLSKSESIDQILDFCGSEKFLLFGWEEAKGFSLFSGAWEKLPRSQILFNFGCPILVHKRLKKPQILGENAGLCLRAEVLFRASELTLSQSRAGKPLKVHSLECPG